MFDKIVEIIAEQLGCDADLIGEDSAILEELGADSLDIVEILMAVEENYEVSIPDEEMPNLRTVKDIMLYLEANM
ncbi:MAG: acyl carrier protein [Clostridia bacterium]|nr:acyl carrier protein [Clostridia bacterium]